MYHYGMYRPGGNTEVKDHIMDTSDIVIFYFGLHWTPLEEGDFGHAMTNFLKAANGKNVTVLAWRETSAQHFDAPGGHYGLERGTADKCVPIDANNSNGRNFRWPSMQQAAHDAGLIWKNPLDANFGDDGDNRNELIVLPFRNYTAPLHYLHPGECTHYCHTPYLWLPIWQALRIAMDRAARRPNTTRMV